MVKEVTEALKCDFCESTKGVVTFTVSANTGEVIVSVVDLCETHNKPFVKALQVGSRGPRAHPQPVSRRSFHEVKAFDFTPPTR